MCLLDMKNKKSVIKLFFASIPFVLLAFKSTSNKQDTINSAIKTVVIDAGHGGKDPGCHGAASNEKSVCLSIALKLGNAIKAKYPGIKVIYTRDKDVFVELDERAKIANRAKADLFICIHANSASPAAFGTETYVLGLHRTESQAKIADRENSTIYLEADKGEKYKDFDLSPDAIIARQLQLSVFLDQSILFASKLQQEFKKLGRYDRGVKQAGFLVLYKTTMPSVLIETGFLTNPGEEKFLGENDGQIRMANAMFSAFEKYKSDLEGVTSVTNKPIIEEVPEAPKQNLPSTVEPTKELVIFRIQIETSEVKLAKNAARFKGFEVMEYQQDGFFKYTTGQFENDFKAANAYKNELRQKGFPNAFVVAFQNGERINLEKAIKLAEN
jgi:N-acetylmuramoyl-L-alanine amidase